MYIDMKNGRSTIPGSLTLKDGQMNPEQTLILGGFI
jgi:hypothetical protein